MMSYRIKLSDLKRLVSSQAFPVLLILLPSSFLYPRFVFANVLMILLAFIWVAKGDLFNRLRRLRFIFKSRIAVLFISTYLVYALWLVYSENTAVGIYLLEKKIPILIFPIILSTEIISERLLNRILLSFIFSCFIATIVSFVSVGEFYQLLHPSFSVYLFRESLTEFLNLGTPYFSLYITFAIIIICFFIFKYWKAYNIYLKMSISLLLGYFVAVDILLSSRMSLLALLFFIVAGCFHLFLEHKLTGILILVMAITVFTYIYWKFPFISDRFKEITRTEWLPPVGIHYNSTNLRIGIWTCCLDILEQNWLFGLGSGDVQSHLNNCYQSKGYSEVMYSESYSTHNEYFNIWLNTGLLGLSLLLISLFFPLKISLQQGYFFYAAFLVLIILCMTTEALLERQKGIIFYAFFNSLLAFQYFNKYSRLEKRI